MCVCGFFFTTQPNHSTSNKQTVVCGHVAVSVARPWVHCGCSVAKSVNAGGSAASSYTAVEATAAEVKRMAHDAFHVNK